MKHPQEIDQDFVLLHFIFGPNRLSNEHELSFVSSLTQKT